MASPACVPVAGLATSRSGVLTMSTASKKVEMSALWRAQLTAPAQQCQCHGAAPAGPPGGRLFQRTARPWNRSLQRSDGGRNPLVSQEIGSGIPLAKVMGVHG